MLSVREAASRLGVSYSALKQWIYKGSVRTVRIGAPGQEVIDLQPCGGTHVSNTSEIGAVVVTRIEKKSATTRRVVLGFAA